MNSELASIQSLWHAQQLGELGQEQFELLDRYRVALWEANTKLNLTRHTSVELFVHRDLVDCARLAAQLAPNEEVLDFGSGGGVPGLVLAIIRPDLSVHVCDNVGKKAKALAALVDELGLPVPVHSVRVQSLLGDLTFDSLVSRAVGPLHRMLTWLNPHWHCFRRLLAIKGPRWVEERGDARHRGSLANIDLRKIDEYETPGHDGKSVILQLNRSST